MGTLEVIKDVLLPVVERAERLKALGAIPDWQVREGLKAVPYGWRRDKETAYWLPPSVQI